MTAGPFVLFGPAHLVTLAVIATASSASAIAVRRNPDRPLATAIALALAAVALFALVLDVLAGVREGRPWTRWMPLQLCDVAALLAVAALAGRSRRAAELLWFWAMAGTLLALLTPDVARGFPSESFVLFFAKHGAVVAGAATATFGFGLTPRKGAPARAFGWTLAFAAAIGALDWTTKANFFYLRAKPARPTLLDWLGPWPLYLVSVAASALALFWLLDLPFRRRRR